MITARMMGGLGNIMFQIAAIQSLAKRNGDSVDVAFSAKTHYIPEDIPEVNRPNIREYSSSILRNVNVIEEEIPYNNYYRCDWDYQSIPFGDNVCYEGYFQSEKHFLDCSEYIRELFSPSDDDFDYIFDKYEDIDFENSTFLHVRRGDYVNIDLHPLCPLDYYRRSLDIFSENERVLVFSNDIPWCRENFNSDYDYFFVENEKDYMEMYMMSLCKNAIIANSSFSWWGAWLGDCKTIAPKNWLNSEEMDWSDIYREGWLVI